MRRYFVTVLLVSATAVFAACGGDDTQPDASPAAAPATEGPKTVVLNEPFDVVSDGTVMATAKVTQAIKDPECANDDVSLALQTWSAKHTALVELEVTTTAEYDPLDMYGPSYRDFAVAGPDGKFTQSDSLAPGSCDRSKEPFEQHLGPLVTYRGWVMVGSQTPITQLAYKAYMGYRSNLTVINLP